MSTEESALSFWGWTAVRYVVLLVVLTVGLLLIDPNYFDLPLAVAEGGLAADQAPPAPFTTEVTFRADSGEPVLMVFGARDQSLDATAELINPDGNRGLNQSLTLLRPQATQKTAWVSHYGATTAIGTYTLRLTQNQPGRIKIYFFQGPFTARMIFLPCLAAIFLFIFQVIRSSRKPSAAVALPGLVEQPA